MSKQYLIIKNNWFVKKNLTIKKRRILGVFFLVSFILTLLLSHISIGINQVALGTVVKGQNQNVSQSVHKGVEYYDKGKFREAVQQWERALNTYKKNKQLPQEAIVRGNLAIAYEQLGDLEQTIKQWKQVVTLHQQLQNPRETGRALTELAQAYSSLGQPKKAIELICGIEEKDIEAEKADKKPSCLPGSALEIATTQQDEKGKVAALGSIGEAYRQLAKYRLAIRYLEDGEKVSDASKNFLILNSLGNVYLSQAKLWNLRAESAEKSRPDKYDEFLKQTKFSYQKAQKSFQDSLEIAINKNDKSATMRALINLTQVYFRSKKLNLFEQNQLDLVVEKALAILEELPDSRQKVYAAIDLANLPADNIDYIDNIDTLRLTQCASNQQTNRKLPSTEVNRLLNKAIKIAESIKDFRSQSFALGARGHFYECQGNYERALDLTRQALIIADQDLKAKDSLYLWEWQTGRLLLKKGNDLQAADAYERAFQTLEKIRSDILTANRDFQLNFQDVIQPIYRKLAELKLESAEKIISLQQKSNTKASKEANQRNDNLNTAREIINSLKLAELQNYFGNECLLASIKEKEVDELLGDNTAVFSSIILENQTAILLNLPNKKSYFKWIKQENNPNITTEQLNELIRDFRQSLINAPKDIDGYNTTQAANLYELLIAPFEEYINKNSEEIKTFVFVQDGFFRSIPMAALYDRNQKKYLIEKYAVATTPSLRLTAPKKLNTNSSRTLVLGVDEAANIDGQEYPALLNVEQEIKNVQKVLPNTKILLNQDFTLDNLQQKLNKTVYPIIHIATHAQFGILPEDTLLVAGNNQKLTINELEKILREFSGGVDSIELLSLTACETAVGDERSTLGLAGIALQVGVRSTLASLWSVPDESTSILVKEFYQNLRAGKSKAEALQQAQIKLLQAKKIDDINKQYDNPAFWAPFIMIGNWL